MARRIDTYLQDLVAEEKFAFYEAVREFSDAEVAPHLLDWERKHLLVPDDCLAKMSELGLFGLPITTEYGGQGGDHTDLCLLGLALGYHSQSVAITPGAAISLGAKPLQLCGTDAQKKPTCPTSQPASACSSLAYLSPAAAATPPIQKSPRSSEAATG